MGCLECGSLDKEHLAWFCPKCDEKYARFAKECEKQMKNKRKTNQKEVERVREIKFRVYGGNWSREPKKRMIYCGKITDSDFYRPQSDDVVYMQYTGLEDKNGKEIYEGDIVEYKETSMGGYNDMVGVVKFMECAWWIDDESRSFANPLFCETAELTVIGNIYEKTL